MDGLSSFLSWAHPPPAPHLPKPLSIWRSRAASHDPLPGLEGGGLRRDLCCEEGNRKSEEGADGSRGEGAGSTCTAVLVKG